MFSFRNLLIVALIAFLGLFVISCSQNDQKNANAGGEQKAQTTPVQKDTGPELPKPLMAELSGWLGFAVVTESDREDEHARFNWSPGHPDGQAIIFEDSDPSESDWAKVPAGARLMAVTPTGNVEVTFLRSSSERYGCEENTTAMASFRASQPLPEGSVWLLPPGAAANASAMPLQEAPLVDKKFREWSAGSVRVRLEKTDKYKATLSVSVDNQPAIIARTIEKDVEREREMLGEGEDVPPIDVRGEGISVVGIPEPVGVFRLGAQGTVVIVLATYSFEGIHFEPLLIEPKGAKEGADLYVYICAF